MLIAKPSLAGLATTDGVWPLLTSHSDAVVTLTWWYRAPAGLAVGQRHEAVAVASTAAVDETLTSVERRVVEETGYEGPARTSVRSQQTGCGYGTECTGVRADRSFTIHATATQ